MTRIDSDNMIATPRRDVGRMSARRSVYKVMIALVLTALPWQGIAQPTGVDAAVPEVTRQEELAREAEIKRTQRNGLPPTRKPAPGSMLKSARFGLIAAASIRH
jgi:hypothetical protein